MPDIDLGYRKVNRSAYARSTGQRLAIYLGTCEEHDRPVRHEGKADRAPQPGRYLIPCPEGGHTITAERLVAVTTHVECDGSCMGARRPYCSCGCGGANHGKSWGTTVTREEFESALVAYRAERDKIEAKRVQRQQARERKERQSFENWAASNAEIVQALEAHKPDELGYPQPGSNDFLCDLARRLVHGKILTDNQVAAAQRSFASARAREIKRQAYEAAKRTCPEGKVSISGKIVKVTCREGYMGGTLDMKATVACEGYAVWITLPASVQDWARDNRADVIYTGRQTYAYTDYEGIGGRWTEALKGTEISFSATVERSQKDQSFGFAKRPVQVNFAAPDRQASR